MIDSFDALLIKKVIYFNLLNFELI